MRIACFDGKVPFRLQRFGRVANPQVGRRIAKSSQAHAIEEQLDGGKDVLLAQASAESRIIVRSRSHEDAVLDPELADVDLEASMPTISLGAGVVGMQIAELLDRRL